MKIIEANNISKKYVTYYYGPGLSGILKGIIKREKRITEAVKNVSFTIDKGEIVSYIGPNGAGKSTTIKMLSGILEPTNGEIRICGIDPFKNRKKHAANIGVVFGQRSQLRWDIPAKDSLKLIAKIYCIPEEIYHKRMSKFQEILEFEKFIEKPVRQLSLGQRMRVDLVASLLHNPSILFLDEPTIGLDVIAKAQIRDFIKYINIEDKVTVILTSHDTQDVEKLSDRIILINEGEIEFNDTYDVFKSTYGKYRLLTVVFDNEIENKKIEYDSKKIVEISNNHIKIIVEKKDWIKDIIFNLSQYGDIRDFNVVDEDADSIVKRAYRNICN